MKMLKICRQLAIVTAGLACVVLLTAPPVIAQEGGDSQIFLAGFNAYQQKEYATAVTRLSEVLQKHPDTPLRDMTLFWLARSHYKAGNRQDAARYMAQFSREYPDNPLKNTVEEELLTLAAQFEKSGQSTVVAKAEEERKAREAAEQQRLAALKAETDRAAREKAEAERIALAKAEADRLATQKAESERAAKAKAEAERIAQQKATAELLAKREAEREAAVRAEKARILKAKAEEERKVREELEQQRLAAEKSESERVAREKAEAARLAAIKQEEEKRKAAVATEQAARENAEKQRLAQLKTEQDRLAAEKAKAEQLAAQKAAEERAAAEKAAARKAEQDRLAAENAEKQRLAQLKAEQDRLAAEKAESERVAKAKAESERMAQEKAQAEQLAAQKAAEERKAAEKAAARKAEQDRLAAQQAAEQQKSAEKAAAAATVQREQQAARKAAEEQRLAEKARAEQQALREKAIADYKGILERFPGTPAAQTAAIRLKELGVTVAVPVAAATSTPPAPNTQVLSLEVAQYAAFEFAVKPPAAAVEVVRSTAIPFELVNRGNGPDSFYLASGFPAEFGARFVSAAAPEQAINQTPVLQPGERFAGIMHLQVPAATIDGLRITHPIKAASSFTGEVSQSREITLTASAPLLRAVIKVDKNQPAPGERVQYRVTLLNVGSMAASDVTLRLNYPAQYEPVDGGTAGLRKEMQAALVQDGLQLKSGESREFVASFQVKDEALAREELIVRADLINTPLQARSSFHAAAVSVQPISAVAVKLANNRVVAIPGQTITIPATVVNNGNQRERFSLVASMPASQKVTVYHDVNRDGLRQPNEPEVTVIGPLGPREEAALLLEVATQQNAPDGAESGISFSAAPESGQGRLALAEARLSFSRPVLQLALKGRGGLLVPGELLTVDLVIHNQGSSLAKGVELQATWPEQLELMASVPSADGKSAAQGTGWRLGELGAGEKRVVKASFRVRVGTGVGTGIQLKSVLNYLDQLGNRY